MHAIGHGKAHFRAHLIDDGLEHSFGIEQRSVHIENDGVEGMGKRRHVGLSR